MSQYNKTVLTNAGLELAKRANAGQAKFEITRAVTSADDWSSKTIQDIEAVTTIPNIMQQGTIMDTEEVESNNSVMGVSLCFTNKDLSAGYRIRIIGVYVKEEGQDEDFLYAVTTAVTPEYMPDFNDKVLYRFNMQMYLVIGKAQAVNVVINDGALVTHGQFDKYKGEVTASLGKIENAHKEDMSHVVKSASINGGDEILPNETGKLELVVPDPDLSKYVSLEQLKETLKTKANQSDLDQTNAEVAKKANSTDITKYELKSDLANDYYNKTDIDGKVNVNGTLYREIQNSNTWKDIFGVDNPNNVLTSLRIDDGGSGSLLSHFATGIGFGGGDTKGVLNVASFTHQARIVAGNGGAPFWSEDIAWKSDITNLQNAVNNIDSTRTPIVTGTSGDDLFSFKTNQIRLYPGDETGCKNLPPAANTQWFTVQYIFEAPGNNGIAIYRTPSNEIWTVGCNGASYNTGWVRVANSADITNLMSMQQTLQTTVSSNQTDIATIKNTLADIKAKTDALDGSMMVKMCTQAQYDAMTDAQKKSAAWMISDS